jgi:16S rRNA (guanine966-N2)-methyltransferase
MFNILLHSKYLDKKIENMEVIDIFAGSGALGLEALSRGFKFCTFLDNSSAAISVIQKNIKKLDEEKNTSLILSDANSPYLAKKKYDICFFDPPYNFKNFNALLECWSSSDAVKKNTLYLYEKHKSMPYYSIKGLDIIERKKYGISEIIILKSLSGSTK